jgi:hypothetical protein
VVPAGGRGGPDNGGTIRFGQPGQMPFAAQVESNDTSSLSFQSHYNDGSLSKSGGGSGTVSVKPTPIGGPPNQDQVTIQQMRLTSSPAPSSTSG